MHGTALEPGRGLSLRVKRKVHHLVGDGEDALLAAVKVKCEHVAVRGDR
jgi:hypothetical protein